MTNRIYAATKSVVVPSSIPFAFSVTKKLLQYYFVNTFLEKVLFSNKKMTSVFNVCLLIDDKITS